LTTNVLSGARDHGADDHGPGLWDRLYDDGSRVLTNVRVAGRSRQRGKPGSAMIGWATGLLFALGAGLFTVSIRAQYSYILAQKHASAVSWIEALALDAGLAVFSLLALGLARAGQSARIERLLIATCAAGSAAMNYAASNVDSPRSVAAYVMPPLFLAIVVDRCVAVIKRHVLGADDHGAWSALGKFGLYIGRLLIAPISTMAGARRALLQAAPVPGTEKPQAHVEISAAVKPGKDVAPLLAQPLWRYALRGTIAPWSTARMVRRAITEGVTATELPAADEPKAIEAPVIFQTFGPTESVKSKSTKSKGTRKRASRQSGPSKTSQFLAACEAKHGALSRIPVDQVYAISKVIAPQFELHEGSARTALRKAILAGHEGAE
jgi:hypothetical protein